MNETKVFITMVNEDPELGADAKCLDIYGILRVYCGNNCSMAKLKHAEMLTVRCLQEDYDNFTKTIEHTFPGLCEFDYKIE